MREIRQVSRFHKAGQGLFYSASFYNNRAKKPTEIRYIIDCGTTSGAEVLKDEIDTYLQSYKTGENMDFLIISHLHKDHISGLKQLLTNLKEKKVTVINVFLPYFDKFTRIYLYFLNKDSIEKGEEWILDFILDPTKFFKDFNIKNIFYIHRSDDNNQEQSPNIDDTDNNKDEVQIKGVKLGKPSETELTDDVSKKVFHIKNCVLALYSVIEFDFWFMGIDQIALDKFKEDVEKLNIEEELKKVNRNSSLHKAFKKIHKDFNDTSLCVAITHSSILKPHTESFIMSENFLSNILSIKSELFEEFRISGWSKADFRAKLLGTSLPFMPSIHFKVKMFKKFGYIFTGDINLAPNENGTVSETFTAFINHYNPKRGSIGVFLVPHHGAQKNWDSRLLEYYPSPFYVVTSSKGGQHRHPDYIVVNDIEKVGWSWVTSDNSLNHGFNLYF